jgi:hypothetical protein
MSFRTKDPVVQPEKKTIDDVLAIGFNLARLNVAPTAAPRGARLPHDSQKFRQVRRFKLTASLLPRWTNLVSSPSRDSMVRNMNANDGMYHAPKDTPFAQRAMDWGIKNEPHAIRAYQELTRFAVGLGSTRVRTAADRYDGENIVDRPGHAAFEWFNIETATPDGFVADHSKRHSSWGLLEVKSPFGWTPEVAQPDGKMLAARNNPDIKGDFNHDLIAQAWEQLDVVSTAPYVDLVVYKRTGKELFGPLGDEYIWLGRLSRDAAKMNNIKDSLEDSFQSFADAVAAMRAERDGMDEQSLLDHQNAAAASNNDMPVRTPDGEFKPTKMSQKRDRNKQTEKQRIIAALDAWTDICLRFRDAGDPAGGYPWRTPSEVRALGRDPMESLARRYHVQTGRVARYDFDEASPPAVGHHSQLRTASGAPLTVRELWPTEFP